MSRVSNAIDELLRAITEEVAGVVVNRALSEKTRRATQQAQVLSATRAARTANCRDSYLLSALASGALRGTKIGSRWSITTRDLETWVNAGKPVDR